MIDHFYKKAVLINLGLITLSCLCPNTSAQLPSVYPPSEPSVSFSYYSYLLEELSYRRRLQFLFVNQQSIFDGLPIGFVQTSRGNLTFERRDLVVLGRETVVMSRIYDSMAKSNVGFGIGWRLNLNETLKISEARAIYTKGNGARTRFHLNKTNNYVAVQATPSKPVESLLVVGAVAVLTSTDASRRIFHRIGNSQIYKLVHKVFANGTSLSFAYNGRQLVSVSSEAERMLTFTWKNNRIIAVQDRFGRQVLYQYDTSGRLDSVTDLSGQSWRYRYNRLGQLISALHPDGLPYLDVSYNSTGKVAHSKSIRQFAFRYFADSTRVVETDGNQHNFVRNDDGITVGYDNSRDRRWYMVLDDTNRPLELVDNGDTYQFRYLNSKLRTLEHPNGVQTLHFDTENRFTHTSGVPLKGQIVKRTRNSPREINPLLGIA